MSVKKVVDVSSWQGKIDWTKVRGNVDGAIIRCGFGKNLTSQDDKFFKANAEGCVANGIPFGVYLYGYAKTEAEAKDEAAHVLRLIAPYKSAIKYPVYYDAEERSAGPYVPTVAAAFGDVIEAAGYYAGFYSYESYINEFVGKGCDRFTKWVAKYSSKKPAIPSGYDGWQHTSAASIPGISGRVDCSEFYKDFPALITGKAATGASAPAATTPAAPAASTPATGPTGPTLSIVADVMRGKYGNGDAREKALGSRYAEVMAIINHIAKASAADLAAEVWAGKYGNGDQRQAILGSRYAEVMAKVNAGAGKTTTAAKPAAPRYYTVKRNDTLGKIAGIFGTSVEAIVKLNPGKIKNVNVIYPGQVFRVK